MSSAIITISILAYLIVPALMMPRGWIVAAGLAMIGAALLPWAVWFLIREDLSGPGTGMAMLLTAIMIILALFPISIGVTRAVYRFFMRQSASGSSPPITGHEMRPGAILKAALLRERA